MAEDGTYSSPIASPGRRFFTMLGTLVQGRVSLDGAATSAAAMALTIAITYGNQRRQFNAASDTDEEVLLDYQRHQRRLLPKLATTYAQIFAHDEFLVKFDAVFSGKADTDDDRQDLETIAAALKPLSTWHALETLQEAREACGGAGFLAENRMVGLRQDLDVYVTFEGDNNVLLQLVAKRLLTDFSKQFANADAGAMARFVVSQTAERAYHGTGLRRLAQTIADFGSTARSVSELRDAETQRELLTDRVEAMIAEIAGRLRDARKLPKADAAAAFNRNQNELIEAARAHAELLQWEAFTRGLAHTTDPGTKQVLTWVRDLFGLGLVGNVVDPDDAHIVGDPDATLLEREHRSERHLVVRGHVGRRRRQLGERRHRLIARTGRPVPDQDPRRPQSVLPERRLEGEDPVAAGRPVAGAGDVDEAPMPESGQVRDEGRDAHARRVPTGGRRSRRRAPRRRRPGPGTRSSRTPGPSRRWRRGRGCPRGRAA